MGPRNQETQGWNSLQYGKGMDEWFKTNNDGSPNGLRGDCRIDFQLEVVAEPIPLVIFLQKGIKKGEELNATRAATIRRLKRKENFHRLRELID